MRKRVLLWAAALVAALSVSAKEIVKIGAIIPLSLEMAHNGEDCRDAMTMRLEQIQQERAPLKYDYQLIFEDNQNTPRLTAIALKKLINIDHINAVTSVFSGPGTTIAPIANQRELLHIGCCYSQDAAKGPYNFVHWATPVPTAKLMAAYCQKMGYKKVAAISQVQAGNKALDDAFYAEAASIGIDYTTIERVTPDVRDLRTSLAKIKQSNPDLILVNLFSPQLEIAFRQLKEMGVSTPLSALASWGTQHSPDTYGYYYTDTVKPTPEFMNTFEQRYGRQPVNFAGNMADMVDLLIYAHEKWEGDGLPDGEFLSQQLSSLKDYPGVMGKLTPNADGFFDSPALLMTQTPDGFKQVNLEDIEN